MGNRSFISRDRIFNFMHFRSGNAYFGYAAKRISHILDENEKSIKEITDSVADITDSVDNVFTTSEKVIKALTTFGAIRSVKKK